MVENLSDLLESLSLSTKQVESLYLPSIRSAIRSEADSPYASGRLYKFLELLAQTTIAWYAKDLNVYQVIDNTAIFLEVYLEDGAITMNASECLDEVEMAFVVGEIQAGLGNALPDIPDYTPEKHGYSPIEKVVLAALRVAVEEEVKYNDPEIQADFWEGYADTQALGLGLEPGLDTEMVEPSSLLAETMNELRDVRSHPTP